MIFLHIFLLVTVFFQFSFEQYYWMNGNFFEQPQQYGYHPMFGMMNQQMQMPMNADTNQIPNNYYQSFNPYSYNKKPMEYSVNSDLKDYSPWNSLFKKPFAANMNGKSLPFRINLLEDLSKTNQMLNPSALWNLKRPIDIPVNSEVEESNESCPNLRNEFDCSNNHPLYQSDMFQCKFHEQCPKGYICCIKNCFKYKICQIGVAPLTSSKTPTTTSHTTPATGTSETVDIHTITETSQTTDIQTTNIVSSTSINSEESSPESTIASTVATPISEFNNTTTETEVELSTEAVTASETGTSDIFEGTSTPIPESTSQEIVVADISTSTDTTTPTISEEGDENNDDDDDNSSEDDIEDDEDNNDENNGDSDNNNSEGGDENVEDY